MRASLHAAAVAATLLLLLPAAAPAAIVPQEGIAGVRLGMTVAEVRAALGSPDAYAFFRHPIMGRTRQWRYGLTRVLFDGPRRDARVISTDTRSRRERTAEGVGVGSTKRTVRRRVKGVRCLVEFTYDHCFLGRFRPGETVTDFRFGRRGRVVRVTVGRVID